MGYKQEKKKEWLTPGICQKIHETKKVKNKLLNTKSPRLQELVQKVYKNKDKEMKKSARTAKRSYIEDLAKEAEEAAARGEMNVVFKITKHICGNNIDPYAPVKDENDTVLIIERLTTQNQMNWSTPQLLVMFLISTPIHPLSLKSELPSKP